MDRSRLNILNFRFKIRIFLNAIHVFRCHFISIFNSMNRFVQKVRVAYNQDPEHWSLKEMELPLRKYKGDVGTFLFSILNFNFDFQNDNL